MPDLDYLPYRQTCDVCGRLTYVQARLDMGQGFRSFNLCRSHHKVLKVMVGYKLLRHPKTDEVWDSILKTRSEGGWDDLGLQA